MAAPGSPLDPRARGSNALIKQGATLIEDAADVIAALGDSALPLRPLSAGPLFADIEAPPPPPGLPKKIAALLSPTPIHVNDLARLVEAPAGAVAAALTELELEGRAASLPGGYAAQARAAFSQDARADQNSPSTTARTFARASALSLNPAPWAMLASWLTTSWTYSATSLLVGAPVIPPSRLASGITHPHNL
jgi:hypothetical protein